MINTASRPGCHALTGLVSEGLAVTPTDATELPIHVCRIVELMSQVLHELCHVSFGLHGSPVGAVPHVCKDGWQLAKDINLGRGTRT